VSIETPHPPYDAPAGQARGPAAKDIRLRANVPQGDEVEEKARRELAGYYRHIAETDRAIRSLVHTAEDWGDCVVVFTSVHGDMHGAHGLFRKGWPHEESVRVPLLVRAPGVTARRDDTPVSLVDLAGMTVGWAEGRKTADVDRRFSRISMPSVVALPHQCNRVWRGVRTATRKLVLNDDGTPWLFFDLESDPLESKNLAGDPARRGEIEAVRAQARLD
jgi:arylsulfatase A-like enzyme